ncbi:MAG: hypothetical protein ABI113_06805 [Mucilaginibacter sp.]
MEQRLTLQPQLNPYTLHINLYDLAFLGLIFTGLIFALQLWFAKRSSRAANRFLALALGTTVLWLVWVLGIDVRLEACVAIVIAFVTISFQSIKAALANPVKSLRSE